MSWLKNWPRASEALAEGCAWFHVVTCGRVSWHCCLTCTVSQHFLFPGLPDTTAVSMRKIRTNCSVSQRRNFTEAKQDQKISSLKLIWAKHEVIGPVKRLNSSLGLCLCAKNQSCYTDLHPGQSSIWLQRLLWASECRIRSRAKEKPAQLLEGLMTPYWLSSRI